MKLTLKIVALAAVTLLSPGCKKGKDAQEAPGGTRTEEGTRTEPAGRNDTQAAAEKAPAKKNPEGCNSDFEQELQANHTLTEQCSPYTLNRDLSVEGWDLTIEPGVELRFGQDVSLTVGYTQNGRLTVKGTAEKPVRFVSNGRKEPGAWRQIALWAHAGGSTMEHSVIEHAGANDAAALELHATNVRIKNVRFVGLQGKALREASERARTVEIADNDFSKAGDTEVIAELYLRNVGALKGANKWPEKAVILLSGDVGQDVQIPNPGVPYRVLDEVSIESAEEGGTAVVTIAPGVTFQMGEGSGWTVGYSRSGTLKAVGTAEQPIIWTRYGDAEPGSWKGMAFYQHSRPPALEYVRLEYAGARDGAALYYNDLPKLGRLTHAAIRKSAGHAVQARGDRTEAFEAFSDNTFEDIAQSTLDLNTQLASRLGPGNTYPLGTTLDIKGHVNRDTVLTAQAAPYLVLEDIQVQGESDLNPATLTVEAGTTVHLGPEGQFSLGYNQPGVLKAVGATDKPITFTAAAVNWNGIEVYEKGTLQVENAVMEKVSSERPAIQVARGSKGGTVKAVVFKSVKKPLRNCAGSKLILEGTKMDPGSVISVDGC
ncbi:MAG: hypothetical protein JXB05_31245 [Myxococcaceae bacterium]|nr:hypothetical protein [Myxococcaceae bacterium]